MMIKNFTPKDSKNFPGHIRDKKELIYGYKAVSINNNDLTVIIDARFYMGRSASSSVFYCLVWLHDSKNNLFVDGHGKAGGYGYHKRSASLWDALHSMGIDIDGLSGAGETAEQETLKTICEKLGHNNVNILSFYP